MVMGKIKHPAPRRFNFSTVVLHPADSQPGHFFARWECSGERVDSFEGPWQFLARAYLRCGLRVLFDSGERVTMKLGELIRHDAMLSDRRYVAMKRRDGSGRWGVFDMSRGAWRKMVGGSYTEQECRDIADALNGGEG